MPLRLMIRAPQTDVAHELRLVGERFAIGRRAGADVRLPHPSVSLDHARLVRESDAWSIEDNGSTNGTMVGGVPLRAGERRALREGDVVEVGQFVLVLRRAAGAVATHSESTDVLARRLVEQALAVTGADGPAPSVEVLTGSRAGVRLAFDVEHGGRGWIVGRDPACEVALDDPDVSREQARFRRDRGSVWIADLGSKNGTFLGGRPVEEERRLHDEDEILVGATRLRFRDPAEAYLRALESVPDRPRSFAAPSRRFPLARSWPDVVLLLLGVAAVVAAAWLHALR